MADNYPHKKARKPDVEEFEVDKTVGEMTVAEVDFVIDYFHNATPAFLHGLGVDASKLPNRDHWRAWFAMDLKQTPPKRSSFFVIWRQDNEPIGFASIDRIVYGEEAYFHLHIAKPEFRNSGNGAFFVKNSVGLCFEKFELNTLFSEPYAFNTAPNRTLQKAGFKYLKTHETIPGPINFLQPVNTWALRKDNLSSIR
ncbi:MAG TPA: GNAT family protein [Spongiibacteraceae bacterium]|nr:GNAT family protein [Spongiibacteraceae bacterium]